MVVMWTATEAPARFGELMRRDVETDETFIVERGGRPKVVVMSVAQYERLTQQASGEGTDALDRAIALGQSIRERRGAHTVPLAEAVLRDVRADRDRQS